MISIEKNDYHIPAYRAEPTGKCQGGIVLVHEVWGLTDHIKDVAERYAREGYLVYAPNLLSGTDIEKHMTPDMAKDLFDPEKRNEIQPRLRELMAPIQRPEFAEQTKHKLEQVFDALYNEPLTQQKAAVVGYCFGGTYSYSLAVAEPRLTAAVPYYGHANYSAEELRSITCPILAFYGENDENLMKSLPELEEKMHEAGVDFTAQVYGGAGHAFFNDTNPYAYNETAAKDAWQRTLRFLDRQFTTTSL